jgi:hypothetical protein
MLQEAARLLGTGPPPTVAVPAPPDAPPTHPRWEGDASEQARQVSAQLARQRDQLHVAYMKTANLINNAATITTDARSQIASIRSEWERDKAAVGGFSSTPQGQATLAPAGQARIQEATGVIGDAVNRFGAAAEGVRAVSAGLPRSPGRGGRAGSVRPVDRTWKQDPVPPRQPLMSREQAKAGLRDVNNRIWDHNHIEKPVIDGLPPNDPRRSAFNIDADQLNVEQRQYLDALFRDHPPENVTGPHGERIPGVLTGEGATGPAESGKGWIFKAQPGQAGIDPRVTSIRVMEPTDQYPNGYVVYMNGMGQTVNPFTGRTIPPSDDFAHIPLPQ